MFNSEMQEKETGSVAIKNMTPEVLERLLGYIYTGHAPCIETLGKYKGLKIFVLLHKLNNPYPVVLVFLKPYFLLFSIPDSW